MNGATYNPQNFNISSKSLSLVGKSVDARSEFTDVTFTPFKRRPYNGLAEVKEYLSNPVASIQRDIRYGRYPIFVNIGGTLNNDATFTGGVVEEYFFQSPYTDNDVVKRIDITTINTTYDTLTYSPSVNFAYDIEKPNKAMTLGGNLTLNIIGTTQGNSGILLLTRGGGGNESITLNGQVMVNTPQGVGRKVSLVYSHEPGGVAWYVSNPEAPQTIAEFFQSRPGWTGTGTKFWADDLTFKTIEEIVPPVPLDIPSTSNNILILDASDASSYSGSDLTKWNDLSPANQDVEISGGVSLETIYGKSMLKFASNSNVQTPFTVGTNKPFSLYMVLVPDDEIHGSILFSYKATGDTETNSSANSFSIRMGDLVKTFGVQRTGVFAGTFPVNKQIHLFELFFDGVSTFQIYLDGQPCDSGSFTGFLANSGTLRIGGDAGTNTGQKFTGYMGHIVMRDVVDNTSMRQQWEAYFASRWNARTVVQPQDVWAFGDSITAGSSYQSRSWPSFFKDLTYAVSNQITIRNRGFFGHRANLQGTADYNNTVAPYLVSGNKVIFAMGSNDIGTGSTAAQLTASLAPLWADAKSKGCLVYQTHILHRTDFTTQMTAECDEFNASLPGLVANGTISGFVPYMNNSSLANPANPAMFSDGVHGTSTGSYPIMANEVKNTLSNTVTQLATPTLVLGTPTNNTQPLSIQSPIPNATSYLYEKSLDNVNWTVVPGSGTSTTATGLATGTQYYWRVSAIASGFTTSGYGTANGSTTGGVVVTTGTLLVKATPQLNGVNNNTNNAMGCIIETLGDDVTVNQLGRWKITGNTGSHLVKILTAANSVVASGTVVLSGKPNEQFAYVDISPVVLTKNTRYFLVSQETNGGDEFHDFSFLDVNNSINTDKVAIIGLAVNNTDINVTGEASYGPVNMRYTVPDEGSSIPVFRSRLKDLFGGPKRNDLTANVGAVVNFFASVTVTHLGRYIVQGNNQSHVIKLLNGAGVVLATATINAAGSGYNKYLYAPCTPFFVSAGSAYYLVSSEVNGGDEWYSNANLTSLDENVAMSYGFAQENSQTGSDVNRGLGPVNLKYTL